MNKKLTFVQKIEIVKKFSSNKTSMRKLANEYNTSKSSIARILANKDKYVDDTTVKSVRIVPIVEKKDNILPQTLKYREFDSIVFEVFLKFRTRLIGINGSILKKVGLQAAQQLNLKDFKASSGWVDRFRERHDLQFKSISGEVKSADMFQLTAFKSIIDEKMQLYEPKDIWNIRIYIRI